MCYFFSHSFLKVLPFLWFFLAFLLIFARFWNYLAHIICAKFQTQSLTVLFCKLFPSQASCLRSLLPVKVIVLHKILLSDFTLSGNWWFLYCDKKTRRTKTQIRFLGKEEYNEPWRRKTCIGEFSNWCTSCTQGFYIAPCGPIFNITRSADLVSPYWQAKRRKNCKNCMPCFAFK